MKKITLSLIVFWGCAIQMGCSSSMSGGQSYSPTFSQLSTPELNKISTSYPGDKMLWQGTGVKTKAIDVGGAEGATTSVPAGIFYNIGNNTYRAKGDKVGLKNGFGEVKWYVTDVNYDGNQLCANGSLSCYTKQEMSIKEVPDYFYTKPNSFQQVIEYNGKNGKVLNFTYRESEDNMARPAFTTNFTVDMSEGDELNYKGAIIKIHQADNKAISYSVLRNFNTPDNQ